MEFKQAEIDHDEQMMLILANSSSSKLYESYNDGKMVPLKINRILTNIPDEKEMACHATIVPYRSTDSALIHELELANPTVHECRLKRTETRLAPEKRSERLKDITIQSDLIALKGIKLHQNLRHQHPGRMYKLGNYNLTPEQYRRLVRSAEEKLEFLYRISVNGQQVQFFTKVDVELSELERNALELYYNRTFTGHFRSSNYPARLLILCVDGQQYTSSIDYEMFCCQIDGCKAGIEWIVGLNGQVMYRFRNHSKDKAHSHNDDPPVKDDDTVPIPYLEAVEKRTANTNRINQKYIKDSDFVDDARFHGKSMAIDGANYYYVLAYVGIDMDTWRCASNVQCAAGMYTKEIKGELKCVSDHPSIHDHDPPKKLQKIKRPYLTKIEDFKYKMEAQFGTFAGSKILIQPNTLFMYSVQEEKVGSHITWKCKRKIGFGMRAITKVIDSKTMVHFEDSDSEPEEENDEEENETPQNKRKQFKVKSIPDTEYKWVPEFNSNGTNLIEPQTRNILRKITTHNPDYQLWCCSKIDATKCKARAVTKKIGKKKNLMAYFNFDHNDHKSVAVKRKRSK